MVYYYNTVGENGDFEALYAKNIANSNTTMLIVNHQQEIAYGWLDVDLLARAFIHTNWCLPLRQLDFLDLAG